MLTKLSGLISALFVLLLADSAAQAQAFGPAEWIRQGWSESFLYPLGIAVGEGDEVFVTGELEMNGAAYFAEVAVDSSDTRSPHIRRLATAPRRSGFLARYDGVDGALVFAQPGLGMAMAPHYETPITPATATIDQRQ